MGEVTTVGLDTAKSMFQVHGIDAEGAVIVQRKLPRSRLLTVNYAGHTSLGQSACVTRTVDAYLINGSLPPPGTVCQSDRQPFERPSAQERETLRDLRRVLIGR